jgi:PKD repeat protein
VTATALGTGGRLLSGIPVNFTVNRGTLSATSAVTNAQGQAQVTLTTNGETTVTVFAGTVKAEATVTGRPGPSVVLTCTVAGANNCAIASVGQTVIFNAAREANSGTLTSASIDFGDNSNQSLGTLSSPTSVPHTYTQAGTYTARLTGTDGNGESSSSVQVIQVSAATATIATGKSGNTVTATATVSAPVTQYAWDFGDGFMTTTTTNTAQRTYLAAGTYVITVTATLQGGGTVSGTTTVAVP